MTATGESNGRIVLGHRVRELRRRVGKTLDELGEVTGLSKSTLSKIENGTLSVSYDNLVKLAMGLSIDLAAFFVDGRDTPRSLGNGRRSVTRRGQGQIYDTAMYRYEMLCADLNPRCFYPIVATLHAHTVSTPQALIGHPGEEFVFVLEGSIAVHSEFYNPLNLEAGDCMYFDSTMGHALISTGNKEARILWIATHVGPPEAHSGSESAKSKNPAPAR